MKSGYVIREPESEDPLTSQSESDYVSPSENKIKIPLLSLKSAP